MHSISRRRLPSRQRRRLHAPSTLSLLSNQTITLKPYSQVLQIRLRELAAQAAQRSIRSALTHTRLGWCVHTEVARAYEGTKRKVAKAQQHEAAMQASQHADGWGDRRAYGAGPVCQEDPVASLAAGRRIYIRRGRGLHRRPALVTACLTPGFDVTRGFENFRAGL